MRHAITHTQRWSTELRYLATGNNCEDRNDIHVCATINYPHNKTNKCTIPNYIFFYTQFVITPTCCDLP
jgi:hypothetical protein